MTRNIEFIGIALACTLATACAMGADTPSPDTPACAEGTDCTESETAVNPDPETCSSTLEGPSPYLVFAARTLSLVEGNTYRYTVRLGTKPCASVHLTFRDNPELRATPSLLSFSVIGWDVPQPIDIEAIQDLRRDTRSTAQITYTVSSYDIGYNAMQTQSRQISVLDRAPIWHVSLGQGADSANDVSMNPTVTNDGRFVAFSSAASNLVQDDRSGHVDVFVRDMKQDSTVRATHGPVGEANADTERGVISANGTFVALVTKATNLAPSEGSLDQQLPGATQVYLHNRKLATNSLVSPGCANCSREIFPTVALSADGANLAYATRRPLGNQSVDSEGDYDVFVFDTVSGETVQASLSATGENGVRTYWGADAFAPTISSSGRFVGFTSSAKNLVTPEIATPTFHTYTKDTYSNGLDRLSRDTGGTTNCDNNTIHAHSSTPHIATDGATAAFDSDCRFDLEPWQATDGNNRRDVFVRYAHGYLTVRVSVATDGTEANGTSTTVGMSDDGRYVAFKSTASNLVVGDTNNAQDLFVHDLQTGKTTLVSVAANWGSIKDGVLDAAMSRNGQFVVFSTTTQLTDTDRNGSYADIYLRQLW